MRMKLTTAVLIAFLVQAFAGCGGSGDSAKTDGESAKYTIAVIPKGSTSEFWKSIHAGAVKAMRELDNVEIIWKGPIKEDDREEQLQIVETFISSRVSAIVLAPLDNRSLIRPVREAKSQGIPTIVIDSDLDGEDHVSFVATNNYKGGVLGAKRLGELIDGKGKIIMLRYMEGSASTTNREQGFLDTIEGDFPGIELLSDNQYAGPTTESAYQAAENLLNRFTEVDAVFTPNESSTFGFLRALQTRGVAGKLTFVGFDSSENLIEALSKGELKGLVLQNPFMMGYLGVKLAAAHLNGEVIEKQVDTGVTVATPENMNEPEIKQLLSPELSEYLD